MVGCYERQKSLAEFPLLRNAAVVFFTDIIEAWLQANKKGWPRQNGNKARWNSKQGSSYFIQSLVH